MTTATNNILVLGNGMVGHHFAQTLAASETKATITVIGEEPHPAYDRVHLSDLFAGSSPEDITLARDSPEGPNTIAYHLGDPAVHIDRKSQRIATRAGAKFDYDKLVFATGSYPFVPPIPGHKHPQCLVYRTLDDLDAIKTMAAQANTGVVIGGGLLGLECANALKNLGLKTHVVEFAPGLMGVQLDATGSGQLRNLVEDLGVSVHTDKATQAIVANPDNSLTLEFQDDTSLSTDLLVFSAGIRPQDQLARETGLDLGERGGIVIDQHCQTSDPNILAIGECALYDNRIFGLVAPGYRMAEVAADVLNNGTTSFTGADMSTKLKLLGVDVGSIGDAHGSADGALAYQYSDPVKGVYKRLNLSADGKRVIGAVLVGDCEPYDQLLQYYLNELPVPDSPEALFLPSNDSTNLLSADLLPASATICSCHNVSKGTIVGTVAEGCVSLSELKVNTKASTGCGGCATLLKSVLDTELEARGITVDRSICEHFPYTRQGLFHLCQVETIQTFQELLLQHGTGRGCDICKPAAASIFASLYNEHVLNDAHVGLQDTNDKFLANIQKNGTYSVVPRIPGGEITPDKLIAIGKVAKRYDLYTKITGGQRIDLFGAQLHELPDIWQALVDVGLETGHAYGKALRTVKSCVGTSWCRYGVQDSVGMALFVENRYKGLRSPHKLKMAVSGCTRECAEAQSKDIGIIASENGWNLFVGGNGGMRPRHADLFATDLDDVTLIRYIDRILMFYVRTADRLQRTSVWLNNLEGGLDYLKDVVINDTLGLGIELETQMANVVDTYQCEWRTTLADPEKLKRFRPFVNSAEQVSKIVFARERGQKRPATAAEIATADPAIIFTPSKVEVGG